jgi:hypothetical protein
MQAMGLQVQNEQTLTTAARIGNLDLHDELQVIIDSIQAGRYSEQIVFPCSLVSQRNIISTQFTYRMQTGRLSYNFS